MVLILDSSTAKHANQEHNPIGFSVLSVVCHGTWTQLPSRPSLPGITHPFFLTFFLSPIAPSCFKQRVDVNFWYAGELWRFILPVWTATNPQKRHQYNLSRILVSTTYNSEKSLTKRPILLNKFNHPLNRHVVPRP